MTKDELRSLEAKDRVELRTAAGVARGTVTDKQRGILLIRWDGTGGSWMVNPQARFDRERCLNLFKAGAV